MASEFYFDLKKSPIFPAVKWGRYPFFSLARPVKEMLLALYLFSFSAFVFGFLGETFSQETLRILLGVSLLVSVPFCVFLLLENFFDLKLKKPKLKAEIDKAILNPGNYN